MRSRSTILFSILITLTVGLFLLDLAVGAVNIPIRDVWAALTGGNCSRATEKIVLNIRLIKAIVALLAGAALSVSGLQMQTLFRNPLAGPYVLGISSGASLGVALVVLAGIGSSIGIAGAAWVGAAVVLLVITAVGQRIKDIMVILILGMMFSSGVGAVVQILQYLSKEESLKAFVIWTMGALGDVTSGQLLILVPSVFAGLLLAVRRGICRNNGTEYSAFTQPVVSLDNAARRNDNRFLRSDRFHRSRYASCHKNAFPK